MREVRGRAPDGCDFGNSSFEISAVDFSRKTMIQLSSAATQGIVAASRTNGFCGFLVTVEATARALPRICPIGPRAAMMDNGLKRTDEDELCFKTSPALGVIHTVSDG
jgi:2-phosphosulfolactate phosphatase